MRRRLLNSRLAQLWRQELAGYNVGLFRQDLISGITVAAVALPLALAFAVASGVSASAGLVTAILAGLVIGALGGAPYQISGPTGAMAAILLLLGSRFGLEGLFLAVAMSGVIIFLLGVFNMGQIINFIPSAVFTGFNAGIALVIFIGQIDNILGVTTPSADSALLRLWQYTGLRTAPNMAAVGITLLAIGIMVFWPKKLNARLPGSLLALIAATVVAALFKLDVPVIGTIPQSIILADRLTWANIPWHHFSALIGPAVSIAILGTIESLLTGAIVQQQTGARMDSEQQLIAQGIGNFIIPFFGGIPATAALARSSVAIRSNGVTRLTSIIHSIALLLAVMFLAPTLANVPLAALGGVLAVTAWRMNDWNEIRSIFRLRFSSAIIVFLSTLIFTITLDLTQAVMLGLGLAALMFVFQSSRAGIVYAPVSVEKMREQGYEMRYDADRILVVYVVGPLFFGTVNTFNSVIDRINSNEDIILSLRSVPLLDTSGISAIQNLVDELEAEGRRVYLSGLTEPVRETLIRAGVLEKLGTDRVFWSADQAIIAADRYRAEMAVIPQ